MLIVTKSEHATTFSLKNETSRPTSIVVEIPTMNQPLYYGAGDVIRDESARVKEVVATPDAIFICRENGEEIAAPVSISGEGKAKIYEYGDDSHHYAWKRSVGRTVNIERMF